MGVSLSSAERMLLDHHARLLDRPGLYDSLHAHQRALVDDDAPRVVAVCGRRSGKTTALGRMLLCEAESASVTGEDSAICGYLAPTKGQAKRLMWGRLQSVARDHGIDVEINTTDLIMRLPSGAQIWILGADKEHDLDKLRGYAYRILCIDEAQALRGHLGQLVDDVIDPALSDYSGRLVMTGTPSASCAGYYHDVSQSDTSWSRHHWTVAHNPHFPRWRGDPEWGVRAQQFLAGKREQHGWDEEHPTYLREWMGRWVRDDTALVYAYVPERNDYHTLPSYQWQHVLGVDFGFDDAFTVHVWAYSDETPTLYDVASYRRSGLTVSDWAARIREYRDRYQPVAMVADTGALGKAITEELRSRFGLSLQPAEKRDKPAAIELLNDGLRSGRVMLRPDGPLAEEMRVLQWDEQHRREDERYSNDVCDAALYAYREAMHWCYTPRPETPEEGSESWSRETAERLKRQRLETLRRKAKRSF